MSAKRRWRRSKMLCRILRGGAVGVIALLLASPVFAETYQIDATHSSVGFSIRHLVGRTAGVFTDFSGEVVYDPARVEDASVKATIEVASINTNNEKRDSHLRGADFFEADKHPQITFVSNGVEKKGDKLLVSGSLTLHGTTRPVVLPVEVLGTAVHPRYKVPVSGFAAELVIKRSDYGVNTWTDVAGVLGDEVKVTLTIEAVGQTAVQTAGK